MRPGTELSFRKAAEVLREITPDISPMTAWNIVKEAGEQAKAEGERLRELRRIPLPVHHPARAGFHMHCRLLDKLTESRSDNSNLLPNGFANLVDGGKTVVN